MGISRCNLILMKFWTFAGICLILNSCSRQGNQSKAEHDPSKMHASTAKRKTAIKGIAASYDNPVSTLGKGLIIAPDKFVIYNDSLLNSKFESIDMYNNGSAIHCYSKYYKPDYGIMHFICLQVTDKCYKIIVDYNTIKYLPKSKKYQFVNWTNYIMESYGIRRNGSTTVSKLPLRVSSSDNSDTLSIPANYEMFCPVEVKDDWVKVKFDCFYNDDTNKHEGEPCQTYISECKNPVTGWIKWKDGNKILIDILLMP